LEYPSGEFRGDGVFIMRSYKSHFKPCFDYISDEFKNAEENGKYVIDKIIMGQEDFEDLKRIDKNNIDGEFLWGAKVSTLGVCGLIVYLGKSAELVLK
jgi:hypothetical protein